MLDRVKMTSRFIKEIPEEFIEEAGAKRYVDTPYQGAQRIEKSSFGISANDFLDSLPNNAQAQKKMPEKMNEDNTNGKRKGGKLRKGDIVIHQSFGEGVIISVKDGLATIAFDQKFGIRKIMADHPSLTKK